MLLDKLKRKVGCQVALVFLLLATSLQTQGFVSEIFSFLVGVDECPDYEHLCKYQYCVRNLLEVPTVNCRNLSCGGPAVVPQKMETGFAIIIVGEMDL